MILFRALNNLDLNNYKSGSNIYCSLYNSYRVLYCDDEDQCAYKHASDICP